MFNIDGTTECRCKRFAFFRRNRWRVVTATHGNFSGNSIKCSRQHRCIPGSYSKASAADMNNEITKRPLAYSPVCVSDFGFKGEATGITHNHLVHSLLGEQCWNLLHYHSRSAGCPIHAVTHPCLIDSLTTSRSTVSSSILSFFTCPL